MFELTHIYKIWYKQVRTNFSKLEKFKGYAERKVYRIKIGTSKGYFSNIIR
jgi:hypothetical protein